MTRFQRKSATTKSSFPFKMGGAARVELSTSLSAWRCPIFVSGCACTGVYVYINIYIYIYAIYIYIYIYTYTTTCMYPPLLFLRFVGVDGSNNQLRYEVLANPSRRPEGLRCSLCLRFAILPLPALWPCCPHPVTPPKQRNQTPKLTTPKSLRFPVPCGTNISHWEAARPKPVHAGDHGPAQPAAGLRAEGLPTAPRV